MPARYGGAALEFPAFLDLVRRMGAACTSSAWTLSFLALHAWIVCKLERELQEELFSIGRAPRLALPLAPSGKAEKVDGGYRVSGRWEWATGVLHADWVMVTCTEPGTDRAVLGHRLTEIGPSGSAAPINALAEIRLACAHVVRLANQAVNTRAAAAGASAGYTSSPLQRQLRDVQMIRGHVIYDWDRAAQIAGKIALGLPPSPADML